MSGLQRISKRVKFYMISQSTASGKGYSPDKGCGRAICRQWVGDGEVVNICTYKLTVPTIWQILESEKCLSKTGQVSVSGTRERKFSWYTLLTQPLTEMSTRNISWG
jgi:hypothetical protein